MRNEELGVKVRRKKFGSAAKFYNKKKGGLGRSMNCAPLPPLLTPNSSLIIYPLYVHESGGMPRCHSPMPTA